MAAECKGRDLFVEMSLLNHVRCKMMSARALSRTRYLQAHLFMVIIVMVVLIVSNEAE